MKSRTLYATDAASISTIETQMYDRYKNVVSLYEPKFSEYNCHIRLTEFWIVEKGKKVFEQKPHYDGNYSYNICYEILCGEMPVVYDDEKSYLQRAYQILSAKFKKSLWRKKSSFEVLLYDDIEDLKLELCEDLATARTLWMGKQI